MIALFLSLALSAHPIAPAKPTAAPTKAVQDAAPVLSGVRVKLTCTSFVDGHVGDCVVVEETHPGLGFGEAAVALMDGARLPDAPTRETRFDRIITFTP